MIRSPAKLPKSDRRALLDAEAMAGILHTDGWRAYVERKADELGELIETFVAITPSSDNAALVWRLQGEMRAVVNDLRHADELLHRAQSIKEALAQGKKTLQGDEGRREHPWFQAIRRLLNLRERG